VIKVIDEKPPVYVTANDLVKYKEEYARFMMHYCGNLTLEDYIRRQQEVGKIGDASWKKLRQSNLA
jgi:hypothetical protein